jgi:prepilin-type N-terminal cleavage/methylation domain-containing protein/prepilin-type processing-associated H-X9-DG protein
MRPDKTHVSGGLRRRSRRAFTLIEMLVVAGIVALLLSILIPALTSVRRNARALVCSSNMRTITVEFTLFAEGNVAERGDSDQLDRKRFWINDFQERFYRIDEFWDLGDRTSGSLERGDSAMLCPAGAGRLMKHKGWPCGSEAVGPAENVSLAFNMRLYRSEVFFRGARVLAPAASTHVRADILHHPYVPLILDVDGKEAAERSVEPFYAAPPLPGVEGPYADGRYWMPSQRHGGLVNVAFTGGHVLRSRHPERERWNWSYQAEAGF